MSITLTHPVREAVKLGTEHGKNAASWVEIDSSNAQKILDLIEDCELDYPSPLSGEYADGYSTDALFADCVGRKVNWTSDNDSDLSDYLADKYLEAFTLAYGDEIERVANYHADSDDE